MIASYRAAARFIEKTRDLYPDMLTSNVSFVGSTALAEELKLLGPRYSTGAYRDASCTGGFRLFEQSFSNTRTPLPKYFPGEAPDYVSLEGYVSANVLIQALKRTGTTTRYRKTHRHPGEHAQSRPRPWSPTQFRPRRTPGFAQDLGNGA